MLKKLGGYRRNAWVDIAGICIYDFEEIQADDYQNRLPMLSMYD